MFYFGTVLSHYLSNVLPSGDIARNGLLNVTELGRMPELLYVTSDKTNA
jgi:hypothetical protein